MTVRRRPCVIVLGMICWAPVGGMVCQVLNYLLGLERLGFEAYYVEWSKGSIANPVDASQDSGCSRVLIKDVMESYGFGSRWICRAPDMGEGAEWGGMSAGRLSKLYAEAEALINVGGVQRLNEEQARCPRRVYLETDPGIPQVRLQRGDKGLEELLAAHTHYFTFAENLYGADCLLPRNRFPFRTTRQAVVLGQWQTSGDSRGDRLTTVTKWLKKSKNKDIEFQGEVYRWNKDSQFRQYVDLPRKSSMPLEIAVSAAGEQDVECLRRHGWSVVDASALSSVSKYRRYIQQSAGEFTIAKDQYVRLRTGWFSDRSACYLAAGRPVITQDTGFGCALPTGEGLFAFQTREDILQAIETIRTDPAGQYRAAREIAHEYFDSEKVLGRLLAEIGLEVPRKNSVDNGSCRVGGSLQSV